jgi:hypothetical protein
VSHWTYEQEFVFCVSTRTTAEISLAAQYKRDRRVAYKSAEANEMYPALHAPSPREHLGEAFGNDKEDDLGTK